MKAWILLSTALWRYSGHLQKHFGISAHQFGVLRQIQFFGPRSMSDLGRLHPGHLSGLTQLVDRLVEKGWVLRERSKKDRRCIVLELTAKAKRMLAREKPVGPARVILGMDALAEKDATALANAMDRVVGSMLGERGKELTEHLDLALVDEEMNR